MITSDGQAKVVAANEAVAGPPEAAKRFLDLFLALGGLALAIPLACVIALAIYLEDRRPIFYRQRRVGRGGAAFDLFKFRSMVRNAEAGTGPVWAAENDGRVTRIGRLLRATALDELPQVLNILKGDLSFVGPRPERPEFVEKFRREVPHYELRHTVRPGLTGLAQLYGRYDSDPRHKLRYDRFYIKKQSFWLDVGLIALSIWISLRGKWEARTRKF